MAEVSFTLCNALSKQSSSLAGSKVSQEKSYHKSFKWSRLGHIVNMRRNLSCLSSQKTLFTSTAILCLSLARPWCDCFPSLGKSSRWMLCKMASLHLCNTSIYSQLSKPSKGTSKKSQGNSRLAFTHQRLKLMKHWSIITPRQHQMRWSAAKKKWKSRLRETLSDNCF